jgi:DNA-binding NtrC family response regulator
MEDSVNLPPIQQRSVEELIDRNLMHHHRGLEELLARFRNTVIVRALALSDGKIRKAAELLKTDPGRLESLMDEAGIEDGV